MIRIGYTNHSIPRPSLESRSGYRWEMRRIRDGYKWLNNRNEYRYRGVREEKREIELGLQTRSRSVLKESEDKSMSG